MVIVLHIRAVMESGSSRNEGEAIFCRNMLGATEEKQKTKQLFGSYNLIRILRYNSEALISFSLGWTLTLEPGLLLEDNRF